MAEKKPAKPAEKDAGKSGMSMAQNAIGFVVAGVIAAGVGGGLAMMNKPADPPAGKDASHGDKKKEEVKDGPAVQMGSMDIPPAVTNLASPREVWVRIEGAILFEGKTLPRGDALAAEISADILAFLRTQTIEQIQGVAGLEHLRADLTERAQTRSNGLVKKFIIKALVVQ
ncbi:flagellar FliL protein [Rhodoblastus acidophilus]|uniref:Flagellar protein FliL n=1 Tax=Rhodoblastus acidophilus TaxID=1074 RepID=A0A212RRC9_RHOAC|nr:flagellar basal body-associated FliL family protein [Rhodoblastus acidophilus]PPQ38594.1 hypothetical protein CKO16_09910 [Rhodoblastus acidophilus]RAI19777.1 hypothetical protein CH337_11155 [Rhodoblastus acidophilus]SNB75173.1 flagellar FliL protein [Rhodoblastus acidophilus]